MKVRFLALFFFVGLVVGLLVSSLINKSADDEEAVGTQTETQGLDAGADELRSHIAEKDVEIARLRSELEQLRGQVEAAPEEETGQVLSEEAARDLFRQRFEERRERRFTSQAARMAEKYGLTPEQQAVLKQAYMDRFESQRARWRGEETEPFDMDGTLSDILTEEQFADYLKETQEDIYNRAELIATTQTVRLSQSMDLSPEVENMIYETLNLTTQEMLIAQEEGVDFNMREIVEERLGSFLTEEQMQIVDENLRGPGRGGFRGGPRP